MTTPPFAQTLARSIVASGKNFPSNAIIGAAVGAGQIVASDPFTNSQILQWPSSLNPASFRTIATPDNQPRANSACYDPVNQCFYVGVFITTPANKAVTVYKVTLDGVVTRLANATNLGSSFSTQIALSQICTDGSFIYMNLAAGSANDGHIVKLSCVDGSLVGSVLSLGLTPGSNHTQQGTFIALANATTLVAGGGLSGFPTDPWLASIPTSLGAPTLVDANLTEVPSGQSVAAGGSVFIGDALSGHLIKISADVGTVTQFAHPSGGTVNAVCYDGTLVWAGGSGLVCGFDPATGAVVAARTDIVMPNTIEFLGVVPAGMVAIDASSNVGFFPNAQVQEQPLLLGRGAC